MLSSQEFCDSTVSASGHSVVGQSRLAPIVLFVFNRLEHTRKTVEALQKNELAEKSDLYIYSDIANKEISVTQVSEVREYIKNINGFSKITIIEREKNWGLAKNIIDGVTTVVNEYGKIIVLEDDMVTSPYFLKFMNEALEYYKNEKRVWHVSGWNYPIETDGFVDVFLWRVMNCWGWATWFDRWQHFEKDVDKTMQEFTKEDIKRFNLDGYYDFWSQVELNKEQKINTWAIFWYVAIFKQKGLCLGPVRTFVENIGHDGSGTHCGESRSFTSSLSMNNNVKFVNRLEEDAVVLEHIKSFYKAQKRSFFARIINKFSRLLIGKNAIK